MSQASVTDLRGRQRGPDDEGRYRHPLTGRFCDQSVYEGFWADFDAYNFVFPAATAAPALGDDTMSHRDVTKAKLPAWSPHDPAEWFEMADAVYAMYPGASEADKFGTALSVVPQAIYTRHAAAWKGSADKWTALKTSLTGASTKTPQQLFTALLDLKLTGTPSDFVREAVATMQKVPGKDGKPQTLASFQGWLAKNLVEQQMPVHLRPTLARLACEADNLSPYVDAADELYGSDAAAQRRVTVSAVEAASAAPVAAVTPAGGGARSGRRRGGGGSGGKKTGGGRKLTDGKCFTHHRYGKEAYTCQAPSECKMKDIIKPRPKVAEVADDAE